MVTKGSLSWVEVTRSICEQMKSDFGYFVEPNCSADWGRTENRIKRQIIYVLVCATLLSCLSKLVDYSHANHEDDHRETHANQEATSLCVQVKDEEIAGDRSAEEGAEEEDTEEEEEEEEEDNDLEENSDVDEEFDPADEEDSPPPQKRRKPPPTTPPVVQRKRGRPAGSRAGALDQQKVVERRRKRSVQDQEQMQKDMQVQH